MAASSGGMPAAQRPPQVTPGVLTSRPACLPSTSTFPDLADYRYLFNCLVCLEPFTSPRVLDCQHVFCEACLETYSSLYRNVRFDVGQQPQQQQDDCPSTPPIKFDVAFPSASFTSGPFPCPTCRRSTQTPIPLLSITSGACSAVERLQSIRHRKLSRGASEVSLRCDACIGVSTTFASTSTASSTDAAAAASAAVPPTPTDVASPSALNGRQMSTTSSGPDDVSVFSNSGTNHVDYPAAHSRSVSVVSGSGRSGPFVPADEAEFHCAKCAMNFCKSCRSLHDAQPLFKGHAVVHVSGYETIELYCAIHGTGSRRPCAFYCLDCDRPACVVCVLHDDAGHRTVKIRDAVASRRDVLKTLLNSLGPRLDRLESRCKQLNELYAVRRGGRQSAPAKAASSGWTTTALSYKESATDSTTLSFLSNFQSKQTRRRRTGLGLLNTNWNSQNPSLPYSIISSLTINNNNTNSCSTAASICTERSGMRRSTSGGHLGGRLEHVGEDEECLSGKERHRTPTDGDRESKSGDISNSSSMSSIGDRETFPILATQTHRLKKLFDRATKVLEISDTKKLLAIYEDLVARIKTVIDIELQVLQADLDERLETEHARQRDSSVLAAAAETAAKASTVNGVNHVPDGGSFATKHSRSESKLHSVAAPSSTTAMSLLVRPKQLWKVEKQRTDIGEMCNPCDVTFLVDETHLVVAEYDSVNERNNKLQLFDVSTGRQVANLAQGQIQPLGVAVTRDGQHLAVTDCKGKRVRLLAVAGGQMVADIGKGQFGWPYGIAANSRGQLIVTDAFNDTISIYAPDGKRLRTFGSSGSGSSQFRNPYHVTVDSRDNILVSDSGNDCVKAFDSSGRFLYCASEAARRTSSDVIALQTTADRKPQSATKRRKLKAPRGISVDPRHGHVIVADDRSRVCMFDAGGRYVRNLLTDEDSVKYPEAVHCSQSGLLAVTEWNPNNMFAVKLFNLYE